MPITEEEFTKLAHFFHEQTGIEISADNKYLVENRISPLMDRFCCTNVADLCQKADGDQIVEALATNETSFFRDKTPFELLRLQIIPYAMDRRGADMANLGKNPLRFWSAGCSTGQETYSMAMTIHELLGQVGPSEVNILGSDLLEPVLVKASSGRYSHDETSRGLNSSRIEEFFERSGDEYVVKDEIRGLINFSRFNLLGLFPRLPLFDAIFCRYVALYFSEENRKLAYNALADQLVPGGVLVASASERVHCYTDKLVMKQHCHTIYYQKKGE